MSRARNNDDVEDVEPPANEPATRPADAPGKVAIDGRGHNVWQWAKDVLESTSALLKRLENKDLALEPTRKVPILSGGQSAEKGSNPKAAKVADSKTKADKPVADKPVARHPALQPDDDGRDSGGGFDPYNRR
jgi:hypothetical protein